MTGPCLAREIALTRRALARPYRHLLPARRRHYRQLGGPIVAR